MMNLFSKAIVAHQNGDVETARSIYMAILSRDPDHADTLGMLAMIHLQERKPHDAIPLLQKALDVQPNPSFYSRIGIAYQQLGKWVLAQDAWQKGLAMVPDNSEFMYQLGIARIAQGDREQAKDYWQKALEKQPNHVEVLINLGMWYREEENIHLAHDCWSRAYKIQPQNPRLRPLYLKSLFEVSLIDPSPIPLLQRAIKIDKNYHQAYGRLSECYLAKGKFKKAFDSCKQAIFLAPEKPEYHHAMGNIYRSTNQDMEALKAYRKARDLGSTHPATIQAIRVLSGEGQQTGNLDVVRQLFDQYAEKFDEHLQKDLSYDVPKLIAEFVQEHCGSDTRFERILDLGCGTGLSVRPFVHSSSYRVGVDVSLGMLEQAKKRGVFDKYIENDILSYVSKSEEKFDLIICTDTLNYLGDLSDFVKNISNVMKKDTPFIFSTERSDSEENNFTIGNSERFAHTDTYIEQIFGDGFVTYKRSCMVREEEGKPVDGTLWIVVSVDSKFKQ